MRVTTQKFKQIMASGNARDYVVKIDLTLADSDTNPTVLHLTEADIWNDTFSVETASSGSSSFDIGTAIIGQCKFSLNNFDERFNQYDFFNATAVVWVGLKGDTNDGAQVYYRLGFFTVDEPTFAGALIQLVCLDNMWKFDRPLKDVNLLFPISAQNAVIAICSHCGVTLQTQQFHGYNFSIPEVDVEKMNCREFLQYVAMIGCNFCIINDFGDLEIKWYDTAHIPAGSDLDGGTFNTDTTPYSDGDTADGGNFIDYTSGDSVDGGSFNDNPDIDYLTRNFQLSLGTDVITITGIKFTIDETEYTIGSPGYRLELENPLVNESNVNDVLNLIWDVLESFTLRTFNLKCAADLAVEVGDCCAVKDYKGNFVYSWVTYNSFSFNNHRIQCNAIPPTRNLTTQYSKTVQTAVEQARKQTDAQISDYDLAVQRMNQLAANASGLYWIDVPQSDGTIIYYESDKPLSIDSNGNVVFTNHSHVWKRTSNGFFSTASSGTSEATTTWTGGIDANNNAVMNTISTIGISFDWARGGTLTLGGYNNSDGVLEVRNSSDQVIGRWNNNGIDILAGIITSIGADSWLRINNGQITGGYGTTVGSNSTSIEFSMLVDNLPQWIGIYARGLFLDVEKIAVTRNKGGVGTNGADTQVVSDITFDTDYGYVCDISFDRDYNYASDLSFEHTDYLIKDGTLNIWDDGDYIHWSYDSERALSRATWNNRSALTGASWNNNSAYNGWHKTTRSVIHGIVV